MLDLSRVLVRLALAALLWSGCSDGVKVSSDGAVPGMDADKRLRYHIGGTVSGLLPGAQVVLHSTAGDDLTVTADGPFTFAVPVPEGGFYNVTVKTNPSGSVAQGCFVTNGAGIASGEVTDIRVACSRSTFAVGGTITGLVGTVVLSNNAGDQISLTDNGTFLFGAPVLSGVRYDVQIVRQPNFPASQTCEIANGRGAIADRNIENVTVVCTMNRFAIGGVLLGLAPGNSLVLTNNDQESIVVSGNGAFSFSTAVASQAAYHITLGSAPNGPVSQTCQVAGGDGSVVNSAITTVSVVCTTNQFTLGGTVTGLAPGGSVRLANNGGDELVVGANGTFTFTTPLASGASYAVEVAEQPSSPAQTCHIVGGDGTIGSQAATGVVVNCATNTYLLGGTVNGLSGRASLRNTDGQTVELSANGAFSFATPLASGTSYNVTIFSQPLAPIDQTCSVQSGIGTVSSQNITAVVVNCVSNPHVVGGTVVGLAPGQSLIVQNNAGDDLTISANGAFAFATRVASGNAYNVQVATQPSVPISQTCVVDNGAGTVGTADMTAAVITCTTNRYSVGGSVVGLASGAAVALRNNGGDDTIVAANGTFNFSIAIASGATFDVTIGAQPSAPVQTCVVSGGTGTVGGAAVTGVVVNCATNTYTVGGTVTGLAGTLTLQNSGGDSLVLTSDGSFAFSTPVASGQSYAVTVAADPTTPSQTCVVTNGTGTIGGSNVGNIAVTCTTNRFTLGGAVAGLASGQSVVLTSNGQNVTVNANGSFQFATPIASGATFNISVTTQPASPISQTCTVASGAGTMGGAPYADAVVTCVANTYSVGGTLAGLKAGTTLVLSNMGGSTRTLTANGAFSFATPVASGNNYNVTVLSQPTGPSQTCTVTNGAGVIAASNVTNISISCQVNSFSISGTVVGLVGTGLRLRMQGNTLQFLNIAGNGAFTFASPVLSGNNYTVTVEVQPASPTQSCSVSGGTGLVGGTNISSVVVNCATNTYLIGGTVSGLANGNTLVLNNNGGDPLSVTSDGTFAFATPIASGASYAVAVATQPTAPIAQTCTVTAGTGNVTNANITSVAVACTTNAYEIRAIVSGLVSGGAVTFQKNGASNITANANGTYTFTGTQLSGSTYTISFVSQPTTPRQQTCVASPTSGVVGAAMADVAITCTTNRYTLYVDVRGLVSGNGGSVTLQNAGGNNLTVTSAGVQPFPISVAHGDPISVTVLTQPTGPRAADVDQRCNVPYPTGTMPANNVTVGVYCATTCASIKANGHAPADGTYVLDLDGSGPNPQFIGYCDQTRYGGGWTLALSTAGGLGPTECAVAVPGPGTCRYLPVGYVRWLAYNSSTIMIDGNGGQVHSAVNSRPMRNLRDGNILNLNIPVGDSAAARAPWTTFGVTPAVFDFTCAMTGTPAWPNVYWAVCNAGGFHLMNDHSHWIFNGPEYGMGVLLR